jgi:RimJ/RimL family protein N-acetyltransferase
MGTAVLSRGKHGTMNDLFSLRLLTEDDWQTFSALRLSALQECPGVFLSPYAAERDHAPEEWRRWLRHDGKWVFGLFNVTELAGYQGVATYWYDDAVGIIWGSYIKPDYRGRGLSERLYKACVEKSVETLSWKKLIVSHRDGNEASRSANQKFGFQFTHRDSKDWPDGTTGTESHYELDLERLRS